ncbi:methyl-accepting chemotaxis protein [Isosphaeraceae bacterium EP7]
MLLRTRALLIFGGCLVLVVTLATLNVLMTRGARALDAAQSVRYQSYLLADELRQSSDDLTRTARTYVVTGDGRYEAEYNGILDVRNGKAPRPDGRTVPLRTLMVELGYDEAELAKLKQAEDNSNALVHTEVVAFNAIKGRYEDAGGAFTREAAPDPEMARRIMHDEAYHRDKATIMGPIQECVGMVEARTERAVLELEEQVRRLLWAALADCLALAVFVVFAAFTTFQIALRPLDRLARAIRDIAEGEGDLTVRVGGEGRDEIASLGRGFDTFVGKLQALVRRLASDAASLNRASEALTCTAKAMGDRAALSRERSGAVADAAGRTASTLHSIAATSTQAAANLTAVASSADGMAGATAEIARTTEGARLVAGQALEKARSARRKVDDLGAAAERIGAIVEVINEIAGQTNMLALNTAIQAAGAGESNQGFAVIATEIKALARQANEAADEIRHMVEAIQGSTGRAVGELAEITEVIGQLDGDVGSITLAVRGQSEATQLIARNVGEAAAGLADISASVGRAFGDASAIARDITEVDRAIATLASGGREVREDSGRLDGLARSLGAIVGKYRV